MRGSREGAVPTLDPYFSDLENKESDTLLQTTDLQILYTAGMFHTLVAVGTLGLWKLSLNSKPLLSYLIILHRIAVC